MYNLIILSLKKLIIYLKDNNYKLSTSVQKQK